MMVSNALESVCKVLSWPNKRRYSGISLEGLRKHVKTCRPLSDITRIKVKRTVGEYRRVLLVSITASEEPAASFFRM
jgi:hypothetical protein